MVHTPRGVQESMGKGSKRGVGDCYDWVEGDQRERGQAEGIARDMIIYA